MTWMWSPGPRDVAPRIVYSLKFIESDGGVVFSYTGRGDAFVAGGTLNEYGTNINADPLFADATHGNYHITKNSPARNAGVRISSPHNEHSLSTLNFSLP